MQERIILTLLLVFLLWSRLFQLDQLPATLPHDELVYAIQAESLLLQGRTLDQSQGFWALRPTHPMYAEWPAQVMSLGFWLSSNPLLATHLTSALMGVTLPLLMALFTWQIWRRPGLAKVTFAVFVMSPLFWQMSRVSYDAFYGLWFYVLGSVLLLSQRRYVPWLSGPVFVLGFFQYQGFKLLLLPWLLFTLSLYVAARLPAWRPKLFWQEVKKLGWRWLVLVLALSLMLWYGLVLLPQSGAASRLGSLIFTDTEYLSQVVNAERRLSLNNPLSSLMSNKATAIALFMLQRLVGVFNPHTLLLLLEPNVSGFSVWTHGVFYWLEMGLLFVGLAVLLLRRASRWSGLVLLLGILTLCLPALINSGGEWYLLRSMFSYLLVTVVAAYGLWQLWSWRNLRWLLVLLYLGSVFNFSYQYFYRYPIISLDWANFDERVLARYLNLATAAEPEREIVVYGPEPEYDFWAYLFYGQLLDATIVDEVGAAMRAYPPFSNEAEYRLGSITFSSFCAPHQSDLLADYGSDLEQVDQPITIIRQNHKTCPIDEHSRPPELAASVKIPSLSISAVLDSGERIKIYGDQLCADLPNTFVHVQSLSQLRIEQQAQTEFCQSWIKNLRLVK